jgi:hypothetical protein
MDKSRLYWIVLLALGLLVIISAVGRVTSEWEWWTFLLILSGMAFAVALVLTLVRRAVA